MITFTTGWSDVPVLQIEVLYSLFKKQIFYNIVPENLTLIKNISLRTIVMFLIWGSNIKDILGSTRN